MNKLPDSFLKKYSDDAKNITIFDVKASEMDTEDLRAAVVMLAQENSRILAQASHDVKTVAEFHGHFMRQGQ